MKGDPSAGSPLKSKPTWSKSQKGFDHVGFFVSRRGQSQPPGLARIDVLKNAKLHTQTTEGSCPLNEKKSARPKLTVSSSIPIGDLEESLRILYRETMHEGSPTVMTTTTLDFGARMPVREPHVLKMYLPTRDEIKCQCSEIRRQWTPGEKAKRWRGRSTKRRPE
jgi:hypothetical protein